MLCAEGGEGEGDDVEVRGGVGRGAEGDALQTHEAVAGGRVRGGGKPAPDVRWILLSGRDIT